MMPIIQASNVSIRYGQTEAVSDVSFEINKGDFIGLVGPNGAGKTTLSKAILGLLPLSSGKILLFEEVQKKFSDYDKIGYLPQKQTGINPLFPASVQEVVLTGLLSSKKILKKISDEDNKKAGKILNLLGIAHLKNKMLAELSGGQQQKVLLARALISEPEVLIFDEPSTALDPASRNAFFRLIKKINVEQKITIILITHDTGYIGKYANKLLYIDRKLVFFGEMRDFCKGGEITSCFEKSDKHIIWHQHD